MSLDPNNLDPKLVKLLMQFGIVPWQGIPEEVKALMDSRVQASPPDFKPETEQTLTQAGFKFDPDDRSYKSDRDYQVVYALPQRVYIWHFQGLGKLLQNTKQLAAWLTQYAPAFMQKYIEVSGGKDPINVSGPSERPAPPTEDDKIQKILQTVKPGTRMKADQIIDLYQLAKSSGNEQLMSLVKSLQTMNEEIIKKSELKALVSEITNVILKEWEDSDDEINPKNSEKKEQPKEENPLDVANQAWPDPMFIGRGRPNKWSMGRTKILPDGTKSFIVRRTVSVEQTRILRNKDGQWFFVDNKTKTWKPVPKTEFPQQEIPKSPPSETDINPTEQTATAAVSPVTGPNAFAPKKKDLAEMTTTNSGTPGYNIPGWVSRKGGSKAGVEGSAKLGYDLTPIGKQEMQRMGDRLT